MELKPSMGKSCFPSVPLLPSYQLTPYYRSLSPCPAGHYSTIVTICDIATVVATVCPKGDDKSKLPCVSFIIILTGLCLD